MAAFFIHLAGFAINLIGIVRSGERPQVLVYAFIIDVALRLLTIALAPAAFAPYVSAPPAAGARPAPFIDGQTGRPAGPSAYLIVMLFVAGVAFLLANATEARTLEIDPGQLAADLRWGVALGAMYWIQGVASRTITIVPSASLRDNLAYNTRDIVVLAMATLAAGAVVVVRQARQLPASGWVVLGPLLVARFLFDVSSARPRTG